MLSPHSLNMRREEYKGQTKQQPTKMQGPVFQIDNRLDKAGI